MRKWLRAQQARWRAFEESKAGIWLGLIGALIGMVLAVHKVVVNSPAALVALKKLFR